MLGFHSSQAEQSLSIMVPIFGVVRVPQNMAGNALTSPRKVPLSALLVSLASGPAFGHGPSGHRRPASPLAKGKWFPPPEPPKTTRHPGSG